MTRIKSPSISQILAKLWRYIKSYLQLWYCHYLLYCPYFSNERLTFFYKLQSIDANILTKDNSNISKMLLYGDHSFNDEKNTSILTASTECTISTKRLLCSLISKLTHLLVYVHFNFSFCQKISC